MLDSPHRFRRLRSAATSHATDAGCLGVDADGDLGGDAQREVAFVNLCRDTKKAGIVILESGENAVRSTAWSRSRMPAGVRLDLGTSSVNSSEKASWPVWAVGRRRRCHHRSRRQHGPSYGCGWPGRRTSRDRWSGTRRVRLHPKAARRAGRCRGSSRHPGTAPDPARSGSASTNPE